MEEDSLENCSAIAGAGNPRIVNGGGQSGLVQVGGTAAGRCVFTDEGKRSFAQDIGGTVCEFAGGVWEATGPYCRSY